MTITLAVEVPADLEGALAHARAKFKTTDDAITKDALIFALRRIIEGIPLDEKSLLGALESNQAIRDVLRERNTRTLLTLERALADSLTLHAALRGLVTEPSDSEGDGSR